MVLSFFFFLFSLFLFFSFFNFFFVLFEMDNSATARFSCEYLILLAKGTRCISTTISPYLLLQRDKKETQEPWERRGRKIGSNGSWRLIAGHSLTFDWWHGLMRNQKSNEIKTEWKAINENFHSFTLTIRRSFFFFSGLWGEKKRVSIRLLVLFTRLLPTLGRSVTVSVVGKEYDN